MFTINSKNDCIYIIDNIKVRINPCNQKHNIPISCMTKVLISNSTSDIKNNATLNVNDDINMHDTDIVDINHNETLINMTNRYHTISSNNNDSHNNEQNNESIHNNEQNLFTIYADEMDFLSILYQWLENNIITISNSKDKKKWANELSLNWNLEIDLDKCVCHLDSINTQKEHKALLQQHLDNIHSLLKEFYENDIENNFESFLLKKYNTDYDVTESSFCQSNLNFARQIHYENH